LAQAKEAAEPTVHARAARPSAGGLKLRLASAAVLLPVALAAAWMGGWLFAALVALAAAGMGWEWARLSGARASLAKIAVIATALVAVGAAFGGALLAAMLVCLLGAAVVWATARATAAPSPLWTAAGTLWLSLPCVAMLWIRSDAEGRWLVLWLFVVVWASDAGAYAAGRALGGPRLAPLLSPNKTWAGAIGGLVCAAFLGVVAALLTGMPAAVAMALSLVLSVAAQAGDLAESLAKRRFGAKDSSGLIPGHGGLLDRLDSLLTATATLGALLLAGLVPPFAMHP
jgi:phosphatidate cytidylyltransferase